MIDMSSSDYSCTYSTVLFVSDLVRKYCHDPNKENVLSINDFYASNISYMHDLLWFNRLYHGWLFF